FVARDLPRRLVSWECLLLAIRAVIVVVTGIAVAGQRTPQNQINVLELSVAKAIVVLAMTFVIVSGEIDLSIASVMGLSAVLVAWLKEQGVPVEVGIIAALLVGALCGLFNGYWVAVIGLPSLAVTLAGLIGYRGAALLLVGDRSIGGFPEWFNRLGQQPLPGPFPLALMVFAVLLVGATVLLQFSGFGRYAYVVGSSPEVARFSGVRVRRVKLAVFAMSGVVSAFAGVLLLARLGAVRGSTAQGFELDIITMVLLVGVRIFGRSVTIPVWVVSLLVVVEVSNAVFLS